MGSTYISLLVSMDGGVEVETGKEEKIIEFQADGMKEKGMVAAAMGTTCLSNSGKWWGVTYKVAEKKSRFMIIDTENGEGKAILEANSISHMQFCPDDEEQIFYAGPLTDRVWTIRLDGSGNQRVYEKQPQEWITHESWLPKTNEIAFCRLAKWNESDQHSHKKERQLTHFNAWHAISNHAGSRIIADTNFPDIGLQIFDPDDQNFQHGDNMFAKIFICWRALEWSIPLWKWTCQGLRATKYTSSP